MLLTVFLTIIGLSLFEIVSSIDNAIINAEVLGTMSPKARKWFLSWGMIFAVFVARGLLPWAIISVFRSSSVLYILGGAFLIFLFFSWFFGQEKNLFLSWIEKVLPQKDSSSDMAKIIFLEVIDFVFSIDGVVGAFAFTLSVPIILIGNGLGAVVVRNLTVSNIERIKKYVYLKNGAMYSILVLGVIMILLSLRFDIPEYISPLCTFIIVGYFFWKSKVSLNNQAVKW